MQRQARKTRTGGANPDRSYRRARSALPRSLTPPSDLVGIVRDRASLNPRGRYAENGDGQTNETSIVARQPGPSNLIRG